MPTGSYLVISHSLAHRSHLFHSPPCSLCSRDTGLLADSQTCQTNLPLGLLLHLGCSSSDIWKAAQHFFQVFAHLHNEAYLAVFNTVTCPQSQHSQPLYPALLSFSIAPPLSTTLYTLLIRFIINCPPPPPPLKCSTPRAEICVLSTDVSSVLRTVPGT